MKTLVNNQNKMLYVVAILVAGVMTGCGPDSPYGGSKKFGQSDDAGGIIGLPGGGGGGGGGATTSSTAGTGGEGNQGSEDAVAAGGQGGSGSSGGSNGSDPVGGGNGGGGFTPPEPVSPDTLVTSDWYGASYDTSTLMKITGTSPTVEEFSNAVSTDWSTIPPTVSIDPTELLLKSVIEGKLTTDADDGMNISSNLGENGRATAFQTITATSADAESTDLSVSGLQILDRVTNDPSCPAAYVCVDRMQFLAEFGGDKTYCYHKIENDVIGDVAVFPFSAMPTASESDFNGNLGAYGPYAVYRYSGQEIDCRNPGISPDEIRSGVDHEKVTISISKGDIASMQHRIQKDNPLQPDFNITFTASRTADDLLSPYIDETIKLNTKRQYLVDQDAGKIAAIVVSAKKSILIGFGGIDLSSYLSVDIAGIMVDLHFEQCFDNLAEEGGNKCPSKTPIAQ